VAENVRQDCENTCDRLRWKTGRSRDRNRITKTLVITAETGSTRWECKNTCVISAAVNGTPDRIARMLTRSEIWKQAGAENARRDYENALVHLEFRNSGTSGRNARKLAYIRSKKNLREYLVGLWEYSQDLHGFSLFE